MVTKFENLPFNPNNLHKYISFKLFITNQVGLSLPHYKYAIINQGIISVIINFFINGVVTWFFFRNDDEIQLFGIKSISVDIIQANFYFTFYTCFFITRAVYGDVSRKKIEPIHKNLKFLKKYPSGYFFGSIILGIFVSLLFTPIIIGSMMLIKLESFSLKEFIIFKSLWGAMMAAIWAPIFTLIALSEAKNINEPPKSIWQVIRSIIRKISPN
ncbi:MAG: hypothetical protein HeimC2_04090 [Candidatus Heimdallarchaeota archaeon LC_2]|nr:MAG: hypothetical protein HeimC2_04090 [Candidatus Heimdallarchaeota archaeon LC_2]